MIWPEKLFHFIWRYKLFNQSNLRTREGAVLRIVDFGQYNSDAGPDFEYASIRLDEVLWSGHIEIHTQEEDWNTHRHDQDERYSNTILHVVWKESRSTAVVCRADGTRVPTLCLSDYVDVNLLLKYEQLLANLSWIPCQYHLEHISPLLISNWLDRVVLERCEEKAMHFEPYLMETKGDWEKVFFIALGRAFGMRVNADVFERFAQVLDIAIIRKYADSASIIEAICFGVAGFLQQDIPDSYFQSLKKEYAYQSKIHSLSEVSELEWKFLRMRPYNFPTVRLAQFSALLHYSTYWFALIKGEEDLEVLLVKLKTIKTSVYWRTHVRFGKEVKEHSSAFTIDFLHHIVINVFVPILFLCGIQLDAVHYKLKALAWLTQIPSEKNNIVNQFEKLGVCNESASDSQGLLHLFRTYCSNKKCLDCAIGFSILRS